MQSKERRFTKWREKMLRGKCEEMKRVSTALSSWSSKCKVGLTAEEEKRGEGRKQEEKEENESVGEGNVRAGEDEREGRES